MVEKKNKKKKNKMTSFRPTHFSRAFRSLDAFTTDTPPPPTPPPSPLGTSHSPPPPPPEADEDFIIRKQNVVVIESLPMMDFERRPVRMSCGCSSQGVCRCGIRTSRCGNKIENMYALEYELKLLQMKLNWMIFIVFLLVCVLFFKR